MAIFGCIVLAIIGMVISFSGLVMGLFGSAISGKLSFSESLIIFAMISFGVFLILLSGHLIPIQIAVI